MYDRGVVCLSVYLSICLSIYLSVCLSVCLSTLFYSTLPGNKSAAKGVDGVLGTAAKDGKGMSMSDRGEWDSIVLYFTFMCVCACQLGSVRQ